MTYTWNNRSRIGKVHLFRGQMKRYIDNPSYPAPVDHFEHWIFFGCEQPGFHWVTAPYKPRDFSLDFSVADQMPEGKEMCSSCLKAIRENSIKLDFEVATERGYIKVR